MHVKKPLPRVNPDNAPFWEGCREHRLLLPFCTECGRPHLPPGPVCPYCFSERLKWRPASGRGQISSFVVVHKAWFPAFAPDIPYNVAQIELEEGPRLTAAILNAPPSALAIGLPVEVAFQNRDGTTLPYFRLVEMKRE